MSTSQSTRVRRASLGLLLLAWCAGCANPTRPELARHSLGNAALFGQFQAYDGHTGRPVALSDVVRRCAGADVVFFGEAHSDVVCNELEAQLFAALAGQARRLALAMEFFEADTQAAVDAYLTGRLDEPAYCQQTRQGRAYLLAHRPLIELCRAAHLPVVAANAPRRLVRAYRTSDLDYDSFRAGLEPADQRWLPVENEYLAGSYEERFRAMMSDHAAAVPASQPASAPAEATTPPALEAPTSLPTTAPASTTLPIQTAPVTPAVAPESQPAVEAFSGSAPERFFLAQLLWDESMADALTNFRARFPAFRVMLIVGGFHVAHEGGTAVKFNTRRPQDRTITIVYVGTADTRLPFDPDDRDAGEIVIYGVAPPPEEPERAAMPVTPRTNPGPPASAPTSSPVETQPTTTMSTDS